MFSRHDLRLDWCSFEAVRYAVERWHYSKTLPPSPLVRIGVWENQAFIGAVIFSRGANNNLLKPFGLKQTEGCELTRIALTSHVAPVSRIVAISLRMLKQQNPGLRLVVSFADPTHDHHGGVYQAGNWIYSGQGAPSREYLAPDGKIWHKRTVSATGQTRAYDGATRRVWRHDQCEMFKRIGKYRYLMPLDAEMRCHIALLAMPYPKRVKQATAGVHPPAAGQHRPTRSKFQITRATMRAKKPTITTG